MILTWPICLAKSAGHYSFKKFLLQWAYNYLFIYEQLKITWHTGWFKKAPYFLFDLSFYSDKNFWKSWNFWKIFFTKPQQSHRNWSFTSLIEIETFLVVCPKQSIACSLCTFLTQMYKFLMTRPTMPFSICLNSRLTLSFKAGTAWVLLS